MHQSKFDFERLVQPESEHIAEQASLPPPASTSYSATPTLIRPDRQVTFDGLPPYDWPLPAHDRDTITVDRIRDDIDGPSHRFIICRGDTVEVYFGPGRMDVGEVTGISHRNHEVRVSFSEGSEGIWVGTGCVYPCVEVSTPQASCGIPLSKALAAANCEPSNGFTEADRVPEPVATYTFEEYKQFRRDFADGSLAYSDYQTQFARLCESKDALASELKSRFKAKELAVIANRMGSWDAKRSSKDGNAEAIYRKMLASFLLDGVVSYSMGERYEDAVAKKVHAVTLADFGAAFANRQAKVEEHKKALSDPRTFREFRTFLQEKGENDLNDEQLTRYDILHTDLTRERRANEAKKTVTQFQSEELSGYEFQIKEGFHDKRQCALWIVQLTSRVERATFNELNIKAKMLGGWFSSFRKPDSGFQFLEQERAERFGALLHGDADRTDVLEARKDRKEQSAAERLHQIADDLAARAAEAIERSDSSLQNTARRAEIQAGVRGRGFADQALSRTMHSIAEALSRGKANYLDGIRHKTHIETLDTVLYLAKWARIRAIRRENGEGSYGLGVRLDLEEQKPISLVDIRFAEYPYPSIYKHHLEELGLRCQSIRGAKQAALQMVKRLRREADDYVIFREPHDIASLCDFVGRAKGGGLNVERVESAIEKYGRLQRANITDIYELRAALREYLSHRAQSRGDDPIKVAERELIGTKLPGFFPTPRPLIDKMLRIAAIEPQHRVLEPSCGKGDIVDAIKAQHADASLHAIEMNWTLSDILLAKGHNVEFGDFLSHHGQYDRIVMNPPFENGADVVHIRHAFEQLSPGGRLVSVVSEGPFFRADKKSVAFRHWLDDIGAEVEQLPDDTFMGAEAFRETSVRTRLVTATK